MNLPQSDPYTQIQGQPRGTYAVLIDHVAPAVCGYTQEFLNAFPNVQACWRTVNHNDFDEYPFYYDEDKNGINAELLSATNGKSFTFEDAPSLGRGMFAGKRPLKWETKLVGVSKDRSIVPINQNGLGFSWTSNGENATTQAFFGVFGGSGPPVVSGQVSNLSFQTQVASAPPSISTVTTQYLTSTLSSNAIPVRLADPDGDISAVYFGAFAIDSNIVSDITASGAGGDRSVVVTPKPGVVGRTKVVLYAQDADGAVSTSEFTVVVGSVTDRDLDGVDDRVEDAAPNGGDMNGDGTPDRLEMNVVSMPTANGGSYWNLVAPPDVALGQVRVMSAPATNGDARNALFPLGTVGFEAYLGTHEDGFSIRLTTNAPQSPNAFFRYDTTFLSAPWSRVMFNQHLGALIDQGGMELRLENGHAPDVEDVSPGTFRVVAAPGYVNIPWQNTTATDVNNDGYVAPVDALIVINLLNNAGPRSLGLSPDDGTTIPNFIDVSGDLAISPLDALIVINAINRALEGGEGESPAVRDNFVNEDGSYQRSEGFRIPLTLRSPEATAVAFGEGRILPLLPCVVPVEGSRNDIDDEFLVRNANAARAAKVVGREPDGSLDALEQVFAAFGASG